MTRIAVRTADSVSGAVWCGSPREGTDAPLRSALRTFTDASAASAAYSAGVHGAERDQDPNGGAVGSTEEGPALRDASLTASRIEADEAAALEARDRLRSAPLPVITADERSGPHLADDELVHDLRPSAILKAPGDDRALGYGGTLYLTSQRLVHIGQVTVNVQLRDIIETSLAGERLLITLRDAEGVALDVDRPRLLRTEIAAAARALRS